MLEEEFILSSIVFGSLYNKWFEKNYISGTKVIFNSGYKVRLLKVVNENSALEHEIKQSIETTETLLKKYHVALQNYKIASRDAIERYDQAGGFSGRVKKFFGFDSGKQNDKLFGNYDAKLKKFKDGDKYTIRDILSMDFNIGLTADIPIVGEQLKKEVEEMLAFKKYL